MATELRTEIAAAVTFQRSKADRTKSWLSDRTGIPYSTLDRKLKGHVDFTFSDLWSIAEALGVQPSELTPRAFVPSRQAVAS